MYNTSDAILSRFVAGSPTKYAESKKEKEEPNKQIYNEKEERKI